MIAKLKAQSFQASLVGYSAKHIAGAIGCSLATAYDWRSGRRSPPKWLHDRYVADIASYHSKIKHLSVTAS
jgi:hypothetical protein